MITFFHFFGIFLNNYVKETGKTSRSRDFQTNWHLGHPNEIVPLSEYGLFNHPLCKSYLGGESPVSDHTCNIPDVGITPNHLHPAPPQFDVKKATQFAPVSKYQAVSCRQQYFNRPTSVQ